MVRVAGIRVLAAGLPAHQGAAEDARRRRPLNPRAEQLLLAVVRGAHGCHTVGLGQPLGRVLGCRAAARPVLHLHLRQPPEAPRRRGVAAPARPAPGQRGATATPALHPRAPLQRPKTSRLVHGSRRQLLQALGGQHVIHNGRPLAWRQLL